MDTPEVVSETPALSTDDKNATMGRWILETYAPDLVEILESLAPHMLIQVTEQLRQGIRSICSDRYGTWDDLRFPTADRTTTPLKEIFSE